MKGGPPPQARPGRRLPWPEAPRPLLFAHRGLPLEAPENTAASFALARERGLGAFELDVHLTADGRLAVIHDHSTVRTTGVDLEVESTNWKELAALDAGSWKGEGFRGEPLPLLEDLLDRWGGGILWDIEVKNDRRVDYGLEAALAKALRASRWGRDLFGRCAVSSFNPFALARFRALMPEVAVGVIWSREPGVPFVLRHGEGRWLGRADFLKPAASLVGARSAFRWRILEGYEFLPWTVDAPEEVDRLAALGASGLISNRADQLASHLASQNPRISPR